MFYALLEVRSYRQLQKINPELAATIDKAIHSHFHGISSECPTQSTGYFLFNFDSRNTADIEKMAAAVYALYLQLKEIQAHLMGFTLLLDTANQNDQISVFRSMRNTMLECVEDNRLWIHNRAATALEYLFTCTPKQGNLILVEEAKQRQQSSDGYPKFSMDKEISRSLKNALGRYFANNYNPAALWVQSRYPLDLFETLCDAGKAVLGADYPDCMLMLEVCGQPPYINNLGIDPHYRGLSDFPEKIAPEYLGIQHERSGLLSGSETKQPLLFSEMPFFTSLSRLHNTLEFRLQNAEYRGKPLICMLISDEPRHQQVKQIFQEAAKILLNGANGIPVIVCPTEAGSLSGIDCIACTPLDHPRLAMKSAAQRYWEQESKDGIFELLSHLDYPSLIVLWVLHHLGGHFPYATVSRLMQSLNIPPLMLPEICKQLAFSGLLISETVLRTTSPDMDSHLSEHISPSSRQSIAGSIAHFLQEEINRGDLAITMPLLNLAHDILSAEQRLEWFAEITQQLIWNNRTTEAHELLHSKAAFIGMNLPAHTAERFRWLLWARKTQLLIFQGEFAEAKRMTAAMPGSLDKSSIQPGTKGRVLLEMSRIQYADGDFVSAILHAKNAIMAFQESHNRSGTAEAHSIIALAKLAQGNLVEAIDYLQISSDLVSSRRQSILFTHISSLQAVFLFLYGNYTRCGKIIDELLSAAEATGWIQHALWLHWLQSRIAFELGDYEGARALFQRTRCLARNCGNEMVLASCAAWSTRCITYTGHPVQAARLLAQYEPNPESLLFLGEAQFMAGELTQADQTLHKSLILWQQDKRQRPPVYSASLVHGFNLVEDIAFGNGDTGYSTGQMLAQGLRSAVATRLHEAASEDFAINLETMRKMVRSRAISQYDPQLPIYAYLYSQALEQQGEDNDDPNAIIGKAAKQLQERSTRIENPQQKIAFLRNNYWSQSLLQAAQASKMI